MTTRIRSLLASSAAIALGLGTIAISAPSAQAAPSETAGWQFPTSVIEVGDNPNSWGDCAGPSDLYCVESATMNGAPIYAGTGEYRVATVAENPFGGAMLSVAILHSVGSDFIQETPPGAQFSINLRVGGYVPGLQIANGEQFSVISAGSGMNRTLQISGKAIRVDFLEEGPVAESCFDSPEQYCGDANTRADVQASRFNARMLNAPGLPADMVGTTITGNVQSGGFREHWQEWTTLPLQFKVANPALTVFGEPVVPWFTISLPAGFLASRGIPLSAEALRLTSVDSAPAASPAYSVESGRITMRVSSIQAASSTWRVTVNTPSKPGKVTVAKQKQRLKAQWKAIKNPQRAPVQRYHVQLTKKVKVGKKTKVKKIKTATVAAKASKGTLSYKLPKLKKGKYTLTVAGANLGGAGQAAKKVFSVK